MRGAVKSLHFPVAGLVRSLSYRDATYPPENGRYGTPMAKNVIGQCSFNGRLRGGSRPGLCAVGVASENGNGMWFWPNGSPLLWPDGKNISFSPSDFSAATLDGFSVVTDHGCFAVNATKGDAPSQCSAFAIYRDRLIVAEGNMWYASRTGDHGNFDYGEDSAQITRAVASSVALAGKEGDPITAIMPIGDNRLYIATCRALFAIVGEPTSGGSFVSFHVGAISPHAWCNADGTIYFLGANGLYDANQEQVFAVSQQIPDDLKGRSSATLVYDPERRGIHIFTDTDWFYDIENKAFWPIEYPSDIRPTCGGTVPVDGVNMPVFVCADGAWRRWNDNSPMDDGFNPIGSSVAIGPFRCGQNDFGDGMLDTLSATMAHGSVPVQVEVYCAKSAEASLAAAREGTNPDSQFVILSGWNNVKRPRSRGAWTTLVLSASGRWAYEGMTAGIKMLGSLKHG